MSKQLSFTLIPHQIDGKLIHQRAVDGYVNATAMCNAVGKLFADYNRLANTKDFLTELSGSIGIPIDLLIYTRITGQNEGRGTWVHPDVAINLGQWLSPKFAVAVARWVREWMSGKFTSAKLPYHLERYMANREGIPHTHFSMLNELTIGLIAPLESQGYTLPDDMIPDISEGRMFSAFLRSKGIETDQMPKYNQLKALVGSDPLTAEAKGSNGGFDLCGNFNVLITSNTRLRVRLDGDAGAWRRRLIILRFERPPPERRIPSFAEKLVAEEGPGILRWALAGLLRARQQLADTGDLALTPAQKGRVEALLSESDSIRRFVDECTLRSEGTATSHELVEAYFHFCASNEWTPQPVRIVERTLADAILEKHGASRAQDIGRAGKSVRGWRNVILISELANV